MTESEMLTEYLKGTDITVKELIERNAWASICQAVKAYHLNEQRKLASDGDLASVSICQCDSRDWTPFRIEQRVLCGKCDKPITG